MKTYAQSHLPAIARPFTAARAGKLPPPRRNAPMALDQLQGELMFHKK